MSDVEIPDQAYELMEDMYAPHREQAARIIAATELRRILRDMESLRLRFESSGDHRPTRVASLANIIIAGIEDGMEVVFKRLDQLDPEGLTRD